MNNRSANPSANQSDRLLRSQCACFGRCIAGENGVCYRAAEAASRRRLGMLSEPAMQRSESSNRLPAPMPATILASRPSSTESPSAGSSWEAVRDRCTSWLSAMHLRSPLSAVRMHSTPRSGGQAPTAGRAAKLKSISKFISPLIAKVSMLQQTAAASTRASMASLSSTPSDCNDSLRRRLFTSRQQRPQQQQPQQQSRVSWNLPRISTTALKKHRVSIIFCFSAAAVLLLLWMMLTMMLGNSGIPKSVKQVIFVKNTGQFNSTDCSNLLWGASRRQKEQHLPDKQSLQLQQCTWCLWVKGGVLAAVINSKPINYLWYKVKSIKVRVTNWLINCLRAMRLLNSKGQVGLLPGELSTNQKNKDLQLHCRNKELKKQQQQLLYDLQKKYEERVQCELQLQKENERRLLELQQERLQRELQKQREEQKKLERLKQRELMQNEQRKDSELKQQQNLMKQRELQFQQELRKLHDEQHQHQLQLQRQKKMLEECEKNKNEHRIKGETMEKQKQKRDKCEQLKREQAERKQKREQEKREQEKRAREKREKEKREQEEREKREQQKKIEKQKREREECEKKKRDQEQREKEKREKEKREKEKREKEKREKEKRDQQMKEQKKLEQEKREREKREREKREQERREQEILEKEKRELERCGRENREKEKREQEKRDKEKREMEQREKEKREKEQREKEKREKEQREKEKREKEQCEKEKREKEKREKEQREKEKREKQQREKEKREKEQREKEKREREKREKEKYEREKRDKEKRDKDKDKREKEKRDRENQEREKRERERQEREKQERDRQDREKREREKQETERREREKREREEREKEKVKKQDCEKERRENEKREQQLREQQKQMRDEQAARDRQFQREQLRLCEQQQEQQQQKQQLVVECQRILKLLQRFQNKQQIQCERWGETKSSNKNLFDAMLCSSGFPESDSWLALRLYKYLTGAAQKPLPCAAEARKSIGSCMSWWQRCLLIGCDVEAAKDYAKLSDGARVVGTRCTRYYTGGGQQQLQLFGLPMLHLLLGPNTALSSDASLGRCWPVASLPAHLIVELIDDVRPIAVTLQHTVMAGDSANSAPREFSIYGLDSPRQALELAQHLGSFRFDMTTELKNAGSASEVKILQTFRLLSTDRTFQFIELIVFSNHGNPAYTCLYRFRVHA